MEVFSTGGDIDAFQALMTDDCTWWVGGTMEGISGTWDKAAFKEMGTPGSPASSRAAPSPSRPRSGPARATAARSRRSPNAELNNGRVYNNSYHFVFTVRDGKISSVKDEPTPSTRSPSSWRPDRKPGARSTAARAPGCRPRT